MLMTYDFLSTYKWAWEASHVQHRVPNLAFANVISK